jgi:hypothetical protein
MKYLALIVLLTAAVAATPARCQTATSPAHDHSQSQAHHEEPAPSVCEKMMEEHVAEIKATSETLAANLAQLKSMLPLITNLNERDRWQANIAMWQALADHFNHMAQHAEHMQSMGMNCGTMMGHGMMMGHGTEDGHDHSAPPAKPQ